MASASERIQISWRLLVSSRPRVGHVSQLLIIEHYVNHVASDIPSCVIRRPVCRPGKVIMCRDKAQLCFKQEITFSWSWKQQAGPCLDGVPHLLSHAGVSCNSRILQLSSHQCLLVLSSCHIRVRSSCNLWMSSSSPSSFWPRLLDWGRVLGTLEGFHLFFSQKENWDRDPRPVSVHLGRCCVLLPYVQYLMNSCIWFLQLLHSPKKEEGFGGEEQLLCSAVPIPTPVVFLKAKSQNFINR